jgi:Zn-dependent protease with chaperone function
MRQEMRRIWLIVLVFLGSVLIDCAAAPKSQTKIVTAEECPSCYHRLKSIGQKVLPVIDPENAANYRVGVLPNPEVNAFAIGPKQAIFFYMGLLSLMNDDELAFVYAHEVAHIKLGHYQKQAGASVATSAIFSAANVFVPGLGLLDYAVNPLVTRGFSRSQEAEADQEAIRCLKVLSYPPEAPAGALEKLLEISKAKGNDEQAFWGILDSHPSLEDRIRKAKEGQ